MGAWHLNPYENDSALDWLGIIEDKIVPEIAKALKSRNRRSGHHEAIAAAQLLVDLSDPKGKPCVAYVAYERSVYALAITTVGDIAEDGEWIGTWKTPHAVYQMLMKLRQRLRRIEAREKAMRKRTAKVIRVRKGVTIVKNPGKEKAA